MNKAETERLNEMNKIVKEVTKSIKQRLIGIKKGVAIKELFRFRRVSGNRFSLEILKESIASSFYRAAIKESRRLNYYFPSGALPGN